MDFHYVNHGMLVIWAMMMYVSSAPLVSRMYVSEQTEQVGHFRILRKSRRCEDVKVGYFRCRCRKNRSRFGIFEDSHA